MKEQILIKKIPIFNLKAGKKNLNSQEKELLDEGHLSSYVTLAESWGALVVQINERLQHDEE